MLDLVQLLRVPQVQPQFDISPADLKLAFTWNRTGEWQIYEMELGNFLERFNTSPQSSQSSLIKTKEKNTEISVDSGTIKASHPEAAENSILATHPMVRVSPMY